ncbi:MAG: hypothetical protein SGCHY_004091 [Lobulomycetales sp.]
MTPSALERRTLEMAGFSAPTSKALNEKEVLEVAFETSGREKLYFQSRCVAGPGKLLAWNLACRVAEESSLMDAAKESFLCRSSKGKRATNYSNCQDDILRVLSGNFYTNFEKLSVIGELEGEVLEVGELSISLDLGPVKEKLDDQGLELKDFIYANRSYDSNQLGTNAVKTKGKLEYTLFFDDGILTVRGLKMPWLPSNSEDGRPSKGKSDLKKDDDARKRAKNRYHVLADMDEIESGTNLTNEEAVYSHNAWALANEAKIVGHNRKSGFASGIRFANVVLDEGQSQALVARGKKCGQVWSVCENVSLALLKLASLLKNIARMLPEGRKPVKFKVESVNISTRVRKPQFRFIEQDSDYIPPTDSNDSLSSIDGDDSSSSIDGNDSSSSIDGNDSSSSIDGNDPSYSIDGNDPSYSIDGNDPSSSIDVNDPSSASNVSNDPSSASNVSNDQAEGGILQFLSVLSPGQVLDKSVVLMMVEASSKLLQDLRADAMSTLLLQLQGVVNFASKVTVIDGKIELPRKKKKPTVKIMEWINTLGPLVSFSQDKQVQQHARYRDLPHLTVSLQHSNLEISELALPLEDYVFALENVGVILNWIRSTPVLARSFLLLEHPILDTAAKKLKQKHKASGKHGSRMNANEAIPVAVTIKDCGDDTLHDVISRDDNERVRYFSHPMTIQNSSRNVTILVGKRVSVILTLPLWEAVLFKSVSQDTTLKKVIVGNLDCIFDLCLLFRRFMDQREMDKRVEKAKHDSPGEQFSVPQLLAIDIADLEGRRSGFGVSFHPSNGLTGNISNVEIQSTSSVLKALKTAWWSNAVSVNLGSTIFSEIVDKTWRSSVDSYLSNGRDPDAFLFEAENNGDSDYMKQFLPNRDEIPGRNVPVDCAQMDLILKDGTKVKLLDRRRKKPNLLNHATLISGRQILQVVGCHVSFGSDTIIMKQTLEMCFMDPATANPLIDTSRVVYNAGMSTMMLQSDEKCTLNIPTRAHLTFDSVKTPVNQELERIHPLHRGLSGEFAAFFCLPADDYLTNAMPMDVDPPDISDNAMPMDVDPPDPPDVAMPMDVDPTDPPDVAMPMDVDPSDPPDPPVTQPTPCQRTRTDWKRLYALYEASEKTVSVAKFLEKQLGNQFIFKKLVFENINRMYCKQRMQLFSYDPELHPAALSKCNEFGYNVFTAPGRDPKTFWSAINKETVSVDPGNTFATAINKGTKCVFAVGVGAASEIRFKMFKISEFQSLCASLLDPDTLHKKLESLRRKVRGPSNKRKEQWKNQITLLEAAMANFGNLLEDISLLKVNRTLQTETLFREIDGAIASNMSYSVAKEQIQEKYDLVLDAREGIKEKQQDFRQECQQFKDWNDEIVLERSKIKSKVKRLHHVTQTLLTGFSSVSYPKFMVDTKIKAKGGLAKAWKSPMNQLSFGRFRSNLVSRMAKYGKEVNGPSEACSTMAHCVCGTLHSPGRHWLHHCPNAECRKVTFRDECGRMIGVMGDIRILQRKAVTASGSTGIPTPAHSL